MHRPLLLRPPRLEVVGTGFESASVSVKAECVRLECYPTLVGKEGTRRKAICLRSAISGLQRLLPGNGIVRRLQARGLIAEIGLNILGRRAMPHAYGIKRIQVRQTQRGGTSELSACDDLFHV